MLLDASLLQQGEVLLETGAEVGQQIDEGVALNAGRGRGAGVKHALGALE